MPKIKRKLAPACSMGYTDAQIDEMFEDPKKFYKWMAGQTFTSCDGRSYNHEAGRYEPTGCGPHGYVYYVSDVNRYIAGLPVID